MAPVQSSVGPSAASGNQIPRRVSAQGRAWLRLLRIPGWGLLLALLAWSYGPSAAILVDRWWTDPNYLHGFLVPLISLAILWQGDGLFGQTSSDDRAWGGAMLAAYALMQIVCRWYGDAWVGQLSLLPALAGLALLAGGASGLRCAAPAIVLLLVAIPVPEGVAELGYRLVGRAGAAASAYLLQVLGIRALRTGPEVFLDDVALGAPAVFSGWSMFMPFVALHLGWALLSRGNGIEKAVVLVGALPAAMIAGVLRVSATAILRQNGAEGAIAAMQSYGGCFVLLGAGLLLAMEVWLLSRLSIPLFDADMFPAEDEELEDVFQERAGGSGRA